MTKVERKRMKTLLDKEVVTLIELKSKENPLSDDYEKLDKRLQWAINRRKELYPSFGDIVSEYQPLVGLTVMAVLGISLEAGQFLGKNKVLSFLPRPSFKWS